MVGGFGVVCLSLPVIAEFWFCFPSKNTCFVVGANEEVRAFVRRFLDGCCVCVERFLLAGDLWTVCFGLCGFFFERRRPRLICVAGLILFFERGSGADLRGKNRKGFAFASGTRRLLLYRSDRDLG